MEINMNNFNELDAARRGDGRILYFGYGANMALDSMGTRCPGAEPVGQATLEDYELVFKLFADVVPWTGKRVEGAVFALTEAHVARLDRFEGYPSLYGRRVVTVTLRGGERVQAMVYFMASVGGGRGDEPSEGYRDCLLRGCRDWGIGDEYQREIVRKAGVARKGDWGW